MQLRLRVRIATRDAAPTTAGPPLKPASRRTNAERAPDPEITRRGSCRKTIGTELKELALQDLEKVLPRSSLVGLG
jgi:hypothetical protein